MSGRVSFVRADSGSALLEFSLVLPVMILMLVGVVDLGFGIQQSMIVSQAAHAGTSYGLIAGNDTNIVGMQQAALVAGSSLQSFTATASEWCTCAPKGAAVGCSSACPSGSPLAYVQVNTSATLPALFNYTAFPVAFNLSGSSAIRVR